MEKSAVKITQSLHLLHIMCMLTHRIYMCHCTVCFLFTQDQTAVVAELPRDMLTCQFACHCGGATGDPRFFLSLLNVIHRRSVLYVNKTELN